MFRQLHSYVSKIPSQLYARAQHFSKHSNNNLISGCFQGTSWASQRCGICSVVSKSFGRPCFKSLRSSRPYILYIYPRQLNNNSLRGAFTTLCNCRLTLRCNLKGFHTEALSSLSQTPMKRSYLLSHCFFFLLSIF